LSCRTESLIVIIFLTMKFNTKKILFIGLFIYALLPGHSFFNSAFAEEVPQTEALSKFCKKMEEKFKLYGWEKSQCKDIKWNHIRNSVQGDPLIWTTFGDVSDENKPSFKEKDITVIMCGVHGDEITPIKFCFDIIYYLRDQFADSKNVDSEFKNKIVLVAPVVNPDSFFKARPSRINAHGVDVNRNFPTKDWVRDARKYWITKLRKDKRKNPGGTPGSEPEVVFQINLIKRYSPDKIISVHAPLTLLDYDGPSSAVTGVDGARASELLIQMSKDASDYNIVNYPYFPGSLGNWAGQERNIPTYTLELPTSNPAKSLSYWMLFKEAMHKAILHDIKLSTVAKKVDEIAPETGASLKSGIENGTVTNPVSN
jgi:protein MpaA